MMYNELEVNDEPPDTHGSSDMDSSSRFISSACFVARRFKDFGKYLADGLGIHPVGNSLPSGFLVIFEDIQER